MQMRELNDRMLDSDQLDDNVPVSRWRRRRISVDAADKESWFAWLKKHGPTVISLLSVLLNIIVLSAVIPSLKSDVAYARGQADATTATLAGFSLTMVGITAQIKDVQFQLYVFNSQFNDTFARVQDVDLKGQALLAEITSAQLNAANLTAAIDASLAQMIDVRNNFLGHVAPDAVLELISTANASLAQMQSVRMDFILHVAPEVQCDLMSAANSSLAQMQSVRTDFIDHVAPALLQRVNESLANKQGRSSFCGYSVDSTGQVMGGLAGANALCGTACAASSTAHVCSASEILSTVSQDSSKVILPPAPGHPGTAWINTATYSVVSTLPAWMLDCEGWSTTASSISGSMITLPPTWANVFAQGGACTSSLPFACCDYL